MAISTAVIRSSLIETLRQIGEEFGFGVAAKTTEDGLSVNVFDGQKLVATVGLRLDRWGDPDYSDLIDRVRQAWRIHGTKGIVVGVAGKWRKWRKR
jgi:hypothetical protein